MIDKKLLMNSIKAETELTLIIEILNEIRTN